jgi:hypothetical protein
MIILINKNLINLERVVGVEFDEEAEIVSVLADFDHEFEFKASKEDWDTAMVWNNLKELEYKVDASNRQWYGDTL